MKFLLSIHYIIWLLISVLFFAAGEFLSKKFAITPKWSLALWVIFVSVLAGLTWLPAILQKNSLSIVGTLWSVLSLVATVLIGFLVFGERLSPIGIAGLITAIIAVVLLSLA